MIDNFPASRPFEVRLDLPFNTCDLDFAGVVSKDHRSMLL
jgi:hypothetical protein